MTRLPHICIDATCIVPNGKGGSLYAISLLQALHTLNPPAQFTILVRDEVIDTLSISHERWLIKGLKVESAYVWFLLLLPQLVNQLSPDLVHILGEGSVAWMPVPYMLSAHELPHLYRQRVGKFKRSLYTLVGQLVSEFFLPRTCRRAAQILALSQSTADDLIQEYQVAPEKVSVAYPAANDVFFQITAHEESEWAQSLPRPYLLTFATGDRREAPEQVVAAFGENVSQVPHHLVIAGKCPDWQKERLLEAATLYGCQERLHFTGFVPDAELPALYRNADVYVELSRYEGFGLQVCEAMATGTAAIASNVSSLPEVVGNAGHLVPLDDTAKLANTIMDVLAALTQSKTIAESSRQQAATFSWQQCAQLTWAAMEQSILNG